MIESITAFDVWLFRELNGLFVSGFVDQIMTTLSARWFWAGMAITVLLYLTLKRNWADIKKVFLILAVIVGCDVVTAYGLKNNFQRQRPCYGLEQVRLVADSCGSQYGFPSNHASNGGVVAVMAILLWRKRWLTFLLVPLLVAVCFSRIHLGVHYPIDVIVGALFGGVFAFSVYRILARYFPELVRAHR